MRTIILGAGVVGLATGEGLRALGHEVAFVDPNADRVAELRELGKDAAPSVQIARGDDVIGMICVPTPVLEGRYDLGAVESAVAAYAAAAAEKDVAIRIAVRSTVPPGTCSGRVLPIAQKFAQPRALRAVVAANPEFLRERFANDDFWHPRLTLIATADKQFAAELAELYAPLAENLVTFADPAYAEMTKCVHNLLNATKISFWNEVRLVADACGLDSRKISQVVTQSAQAAWDPAYGTRERGPYGGKCLPKDVEGYIGFVAEMGYEPRIAQAVADVNRVVASSPRTQR